MALYKSSRVTTPSLFDLLQSEDILSSAMLAALVCVNTQGKALDLWKLRNKRAIWTHDPTPRSSADLDWKKAFLPLRSVWCISVSFSTSIRVSCLACFYFLAFYRCCAERSRAGGDRGCLRERRRTGARPASLRKKDPMTAVQRPSIPRETRAPAAALVWTKMVRRGSKSLINDESILDPDKIDRRKCVHNLLAPLLFLCGSLCDVWLRDFS